MAQSAVSSLLDRLTSVLLDEAQLLGGIHDDVQFIKDDLEGMNSLLQHLTEVQYRAPHVRTWMKQVVSLARDCEGQVELYIRQVGRASSRGGDQGLLRYLQHFLRLLQTIPARHRIATRIRELKVRARDVGDRRVRLGITIPPAAHPPEEALPAINQLALQQQQQGEQDEDEDIRRRKLLSIDDPLPDTIEIGTTHIVRFIEEPSRIHPRRKVVITGRGRVGKTAIATSVHNHPSMVSKYQLRAWVNFGELDKSVDVVCREIIQQLSVPCDSGKENLTILEDFLTIQQKGGLKFMVVLDAVKPGHFYDLMFEEDTWKIWSERELNSLHDLLREHKNHAAKTMLMFCYKELPGTCKTCLLYLSIFPKDHIIRRTSLVRRWVAEGLVSNRATARGYDKGMKETSTLEDQAELIFDALITRGFVQPRESSSEGKIKTCTVHHIIHEFIASEASFMDTYSVGDMPKRQYGFDPYVSVIRILIRVRN
ncbi:hypothetical protein PR202_gb13635 [Eleusine coracana subsp. coracana]|uniref:Uncharacterized protein n=1 Tax=Eleusine coracana subsp. coracana TaxID=191504 RepID=A0AAV5ER17_ELECO|nr:hypothetical protein PR202_gb13635 [Eleusine coracana subsp. coracana]